MSIELKRQQGGRVAPVIVCDTCGGPIRNAGMGVAVFTDDLRLFHAHKLQCHDWIDEEHGGGMKLPWIELSAHLALLTHNAGADPGQFAELVETSQLFL